MRPSRRKRKSWPDRNGSAAAGATLAVRSPLAPLNRVPRPTRIQGSSVVDYGPSDIPIPESGGERAFGFFLPPHPPERGGPGPSFLAFRSLFPDPRDRPEARSRRRRIASPPKPRRHPDDRQTT